MLGGGGGFKCSCNFFSSRLLGLSPGIVIKKQELCRLNKHF